MAKIGGSVTEDWLGVENAADWRGQDDFFRFYMLLHPHVLLFYI